MSDGDYRYSRAAARSLLFSWLDGWMPYGQKRRAESAWDRLPADARVTLAAHRDGVVADWDAEAAAVDVFAAALRAADRAQARRRAA